jgi:hypothetical protein
MLCILNAFDRQVVMVLSGSIMYTDARRRGVGDEEELKTQSEGGPVILSVHLQLREPLTNHLGQMP